MNNPKPECKDTPEQHFLQLSTFGEVDIQTKEFSVR
jgi:hypothetical protein